MDPKQSEAAELESGYSDTAPTATPPADVAQPAEPVKSEVEVTTEPAATPAPTPAPFDAQVEFRKLNDTLQGRIGDLNRQLQKALEAKEEAAKPASTPAPRFKRLADNYPELAEQVVPDIEEALSALGKAPDPKQLQELIDARLQAQRDAADKERAAEVSEIHPGWEQDLWTKDAAGNRARSADYEAWSKTMTPEVLAKFEHSNSVLYVDRKLTEFYAWKTAKAAQAIPAARTAAVSTRQKRLEAAVTPRGTGGHASGGSTEQDEMEAGYN